MISSPCLSPIGAKLTPYYSNKSANGRMELVIVSQPEEQHRARYLTEGSRGAIKDITGMGHPVVKLNGYYSRQPIKLECYIGHDKHNGLPHLFYQASKISGKNSTQCTACKVDGTSVIVMNLLPEHGMQATIDCIGILKERNVDVEQKLLNLNHASKMLDFTSSSSLMTTAEENSFQSFDTNSIDILDAQDSKSKLMNCSSNNNNISKSSSSSSNNSTPTALAINGCSGNKSRMSFQIHNENSNQSSVGPIRFGRNALNGSDTKMSPQMDENSMGAMSRADSLDDASSDVSRHSVINTISAFGTASGHLNSNYHFNALGGGGPGLAQQRSTTTTTTTTTTNNNNLHNNHHLLNQDTSTQDSQGMMVTTITNSTLAATNGLKPTQHQQSSASSASLLALNSRKRSVRCRLVFRVKIPETGEVLQTTSTPIICTQPLGTPEICKKSLTRAPLKPGNQLELFIIGKNFLKDSKVVFKSKQSDWIKVVEPEKEFLNSSHMICRVPNYDGPLDSISSANTNGHQANQQFVQLQQHEQDASQQHQMIEVELQVRSGGKFSEAHTFYYINNLSLPSQLQQQQQAPLAVTPPTLTQVVLTQQQQQPGPLATVIASQHQQQQQLPSSASSNSTTSTILQQQTSPPTPQNSPTTTSQTTIQTTQASILTNGMTDQLLDQQQLISATNQNVVVALNQQLQQQQQQQQQQLTIYHQATKIESPPASTVISPQLQSPIGQQQQQQSSPPQQVVSTTQHLHAQQQQLHQDQQPQQHMQYVNQPRQDPQQQMQQQQLVTQQQQFEQHQQQLVAHQQQQQQAQAIQEQNQIHTQLMMQQHRQQQQRIQQTNRATIQLTAVDLNDENTVVYADSLQLTQHQQPQQQPPTTIVRSVHQDGLQQNGLTSGGIQQNGLQQNGLQQQQNGLAQNGTATIITGGMPQMDTSPALEQPQQLTGAEQITATTTGQFISHFHIIKQQQQQVAATIHHHQQQQFQAEQQSVALQHQQQQQQVQQQPQHFEMTQQQQTATTLQEQQQQLVLQHHQQRQQQQQQQQMQQQQQLVQNLDLNDDSTVVYVDGLHHLQADSSTPDALLFPCTFS